MFAASQQASHTINHQSAAAAAAKSNQIKKKSIVK
jgi:hypothetical protein